MQWLEFRSSIRHLPARDIERIERAFTLGKTVHVDQKRKSGEPYFSHPVAVARMLTEMGADTDAIIAALLHDTVEDTPLTLREIDDQFGGNVATLIDGVTKLSVSDVEGSPRLNEQMESLRKIFTLMQEDVRIMVIKIVDRLHNMQTIEFLSKERQKTLSQETMDVYVKISDRLCMQDVRDELEALCLSVLEPALYKRLTDIRIANESRSASIIQDIEGMFCPHDKQLASRTKIFFEPKVWDRLKTQLEVGDSITTGLNFITLAFVCEDTDCCYRVLGAIHQLWKREVLSFQDFINAPQINGYRGLHTTAILPDGTRIRCKIRTAEMHRYARLGVTTRCFDSKALGISEYLPWTKRISSLTEDTEGSSDDFWQALQSDILGESITIHGLDDSTVQLPRGASALDGAFYFLKEDALRTRSIRLNGVDVSFGTKLKNAATLDITLEKKNTCDREWLTYVQTGMAAAKIRSWLLSQPDEKKLLLGRDLLQKIFTERKRGFIEEFEEKTLMQNLKNSPYTSLNEIYLSIADGRTEPTNIYDALFEKKFREDTEKKPVSILRYSMNFGSSESMDRINHLHRKYSISLSQIRYKKKRNEVMLVTLLVHLTPTELLNFKKEIADAGGSTISMTSPMRSWLLLLLSIIVLWSLNPVIAKWFLLQGITPLSLITIRFFTFFFYTTIFYGVWRAMSGVKYAPIPNLMRLALLPAVGLIGMSAFNYVALVYMPPSLHLTVLRLNTLLLPVVPFLKKGTPLQKIGLMSVLFLPIVFIMISIPAPPLFIGISLSILALFSYMLYSLVSEHLLLQKQIVVRYPLFIARVGLLLGLAGLTLLPWQRMTDLINPLTFGIILYVLICVCVPHMLYSFLLRKTSFTSVTDLFVLEVPLAIGFEMLLLGLTLPFYLYAAIGVVIALLFLRRWANYQGRMI